jgi:hypothetical protein
VRPELRRVELLDRDDVLTGEPSDALDLGLGEVELGLDPVAVGPRSLDAGPRCSHRGLRLGPTARVEQRRGLRLEDGEHGLFGHEKGAFTGALTRSRGRFERADGGTILLDEIGEMTLEAQVRLPRVIQHRGVERVGGTRRIPVDIRIIAASNEDLRAKVHAGRFREDLWFRLNVFPIEVPPLRDRRSDIPALVQHFIERKAKELKIGETPQLARGAIEDLLAYDWPGNVRELENLVERAMILRHRGEPLRFDDLFRATPARAGAPSAGTEGKPLPLDDVVPTHIRGVLELTSGKIHGPGGAGELLGVNPNTLRYRMRKLEIPFREDLPSERHHEPARVPFPVGTARLVELGCMQDTVAGLIQREKQLERYSRIEAGLPSSPACPARSIAGIGWLYDLLPQSSRSRPVDPSGVVELHRCLAVLDSGAES